MRSDQLSLLRQKKKKKMCVFQVSRPYIGFRPDPKHFIVNFEGNIVKYAEKMGGNIAKKALLYKIF